MRALAQAPLGVPWWTAFGVAAAAHAAAISALLAMGGEHAERIPEPVMVVELAAGASPAAAMRQLAEPQQSAQRAVATTPQVTTLRPPVPLLEKPMVLPSQQPVPRELVAPVPRPSPVTSPAAASLVPRVAANDAPIGSVPAAGRGGPGAEPAAKEAEADWYSLISAHLERNKRYPREAKAAGEQGTPVVRFSVDRRGRVTAIAIATSSGHDKLDRATLDLLRRVSPLPAMPKAMGRDSVTISLPIEYSLSRK